MADPIPLDYADRSSANRRWWRLPVSGTLAFSFVVLQIPWVLVYRLLVLFSLPSSPGATPPPSTPVDVVSLRILGILPSLAGFAFGCYSLKVAGIKRRNLLGIIGLLLSAVVVVPTLFGIDVMRTSLAHSIAEFLENLLFNKWS